MVSLFEHRGDWESQFRWIALYRGVHCDARITINIEPTVIPLQTLLNFFTQLWDPSTNSADKQGSPYYYDEQGNLVAHMGPTGPTPAGQPFIGSSVSQYVYLPTSNGPMPIAAIYNVSPRPYAVHSDHLNTPRRLTDPSGVAAWQWAYSAYGDEMPTLAADRFVNPKTNPNAGKTSTAALSFNLRYPGQYFDQESGLFYNYFRSYNPTLGRYTQSDPIGLDGGWNAYAYVGGECVGWGGPSWTNREACRSFSRLCGSRKRRFAGRCWYVPLPNTFQTTNKGSRIRKAAGLRVIQMAI